MNVPFQDIPGHSRIWIFQSDRRLSSKEVKIVNDFLKAFTDRWLVHGRPVRASFDVRFDHFVILAADEAYNAPSGCSIDDSVRAIRELEGMLGTKLLDRQQAAFLRDNEVILIPLAQLKEKYAAGIWNEDTLSFNNLVTSKDQLETHWIVPAVQNWMKRYIA